MDVAGGPWDVDGAQLVHALQLSERWSVVATTAILSFAAGVMALISPCTFPILPGVVASISGTSPRSPMWSAVLRVLLFALGASLALTGSVALINLVGNYVDFLAPPWSIVLGVLFVAAAAAAFGWVRVPTRVVEVSRTIGIFRPLVLGFGLALVWLPCIGPTLAIVLGLASRAESAWAGVVIGFSYFLGVAAPLLIFGLLFVRAGQGRAWTRAAGRVANLVSAGGLALIGLLLISGLWGSASRWLVSISPVVL